LAEENMQQQFAVASSYSNQTVVLFTLIIVVIRAILFMEISFGIDGELSIPFIETSQRVSLLPTLGDVPLLGGSISR
jgi:hypothetical protein